MPHITWFITRSTMTTLLVLIVLLAVAPVVAQPAQNATPDFAAIDAYVERQMGELRIPGLALGIVQGDQIVHLRGFGVADPSGRTVTPQTPFIIGSTTKSFTALAIMQLVEAGNIELDAPIQRYLPTFRVADEAASAQITVRHLLHQTSGLSTRTGRDQPSTTSDDALERRVRSFATAQLTQPVGTHFQYSGANYAILGLIVQAVTGQSYEAYVQEQIFAPLNMRQSFASQTAAEQHGMAMGYRYWFGVPVAANLPYNRASLLQGYLIASAEDLTHYLIAQLNEGRYGNTTVLSPHGVALLHQPAVPTDAAATSYAMGWKVGPTNGIPTVWHDGSVFNFHSSMVLVPEGRWGVVILKNAYSLPDEITGTERLKGIADGVTSMLMGQPPAPRTSTGLWLAYLVLAGVIAIQALGIERSVRRLRRWRMHVEQRPESLRWVGWHVGLPLLGNLAWALVILAGLPRFFGMPLLLVVAGVPDFGYILLVSSIVALGWGIIRTALAWLALRKPVASRPVTRVAKT